MKKIVLLVAIGFTLLSIPSCGGDDKKEKGKEDKEVSTSEVPESVKSAFSAKYSTASDIKWEDAHEDDKQTYKAKFTINGKKMKAEFDTNGGFVKESEDN